MTKVTQIASVLLFAAVSALGLSACGGGHHAARSAAVSHQLEAFQLPAAGDPNARGGRTWQQYGSRPVGRTLTINPMTLYDASSTRPLVLLGIRQAAPAQGLVFSSAQVTLTPGFSKYSEYVNLGQPGAAFGAHANFSPLRGFILNPDPRARMTGGVTPTVVVTVRATRPGSFHIGDWVVSYRVGQARHSVRLVDDGVFCAAGGATSCPSM